MISKILDKNVCYVSAVGENCKENHDALEDEISYREIDLEDLRLPEHFIMTTWHTSTVNVVVTCYCAHACHI